ncbi:hypothetical protein ACHAQH_006326 [Verticillium albo-atrum]
MSDNFSLRHVPALYATCAMGLGGAWSLTWPVARVGHARTTSLGLIMALFYVRGQYDVVDTIMGVMSGYLALVDGYVVWNEGFHGWAVFRLIGAGAFSAMGFAGLTQGPGYSGSR